MLNFLNVEEKVKKEAITHFFDLWEVYDDVKSQLQSPRAKKALSDIKVKTKGDKEVKASKASSAMPSTAETFIENIRKKIERRKEKGYKGEYQKNVKPKLKQLARESGAELGKLEDLFFETAVQWLDALENMGGATRKKLLDNFEAEDLLHATKQDLKQIRGIGEKRAAKILKNLPF